MKLLSQPTPLIHCSSFFFFFLSFFFPLTGSSWRARRNGSYWTKWPRSKSHDIERVCFTGLRMAKDILSLKSSTLILQLSRILSRSFEDTKRIMSPEMRPKSFGTFAKRAADQKTCALSGCSGSGARFSKDPTLFGRISGDIILFVSSKRRRLEAGNFAVILIFIPFTTYEKTSFTE